MATVRRSAEEWRMIVRDFERSGLTQRAYADRHGIVLATLRWWVSRIGSGSRQEEAVEFVPVELPLAKVAEGIEASFPNGVVVRFGIEVPAEVIVGVVRGVLSC